ncbi:MAG: DUF4365 domain-containing protein [Patescibacteria group bacterium]|nr:DUF4365 domain-containing protein [Patescibacteria group bacterium]
MSEKKYSTKNKIGNKGVAYLEYLMEDYCLFNKIEESKDIGFDVWCEWVFNEEPTGVPFFIQVKTHKQITDSREIKIEKIKKSRLNLLDEVKITNIKKIEPATLNYWKKQGCPVYLFVIIENEKPPLCFYKRFTPILHFDKDQNSQIFYHAGSENFLAYANDKGGGGFARDLFIDSIRCNYKKGSLDYFNPRLLGLNQFPEDEKTVFGDVAQEYKKNIESNIEKLQRLGYKIIDVGGSDYTKSKIFTASTSSTSSTESIIPSAPPEGDNEEWAS